MTLDLLTAFESLGRPKVLVLGDFILDRYTWGNAERVSQEAPVILLRADRREARLGGAGNVCAMLRGLEAEVTCVGVVGDDADGRDVRHLLAESGVHITGLLVDSTRPTTVKERFIGRAQGRHPHQMLRVDNEVRDPLSAELEARMSARLLDAIAMHDIVLVSDYDKGVCTPRLLRLAIDHARSCGVPVLVDPIRSTDYTRYRGATAMTPNRTEAGMATGIVIETSDDAMRAGRKLCRELKLDQAIVTLDRDGMALVDAEGRGSVYPTQPLAVYDITGAGDMVLAMIGTALASGIAAPEAVRLGNIAGGLEVEKVGVAVIPRAEIRARLLSSRPAAQGKQLALEELARVADSHRALGQSIVVAWGAFDALNIAHVRRLEESARSGDVLVVAVAKGQARTAADRAAMVAALGCVHYVVTFHESTPLVVVGKLRPDVVVNGCDELPEYVEVDNLVLSYGGRVRPAASITRSAA